MKKTINQNSERAVRQAKKTNPCTRRRLLTSLLVLLLPLSISCGEDPFARPDDPAIPDTLRVPPVEKKQSALQAVLDGVIESISIDQEFCRMRDMGGRKKLITCEYPNEGGIVEFVGDIFEQERDLIVFNSPNRSVRYELTLESIKLDEYVYLANADRRRIPPPNGCKAPVKISGEGSLYTMKEDVFNESGRRIPMKSGGVYQGTFTVTDPQDEYTFSFTDQGFYYRRDITPVVIRPEQDGTTPMRREPLEALQVSLVYSGGFDLNDQLYSYQDVYIEVLNADHWNEGCNRPAPGPETRL